MPRRAGTSTRSSARLSREGIVSAAIELADRDGLDGLSMRRLAQHLGVDAMSIYYHLRDKDTLLAAMADAVVADIDYTLADGAWTTQLRALIMQARDTMLQHPWAVRVLEGRPDPTPAVLLHIERVLAVMCDGGCSTDLQHHAIHLLGSRILGFSQDLFDDNPDPAAPPPPAEWAETLPHVAELAAAVTHDGPLSGCDDEFEFAFALDLILDGLEQRRLAS
ncbi:TetR/AcrR family transcriptional regulator C-terminal domain-containing protein [Actinoplanes sp. NPDC049596]|uniref:TetR/AcrR family transcriptional regulator n=1 Tax=unclassified Actinoplanes TaxID=2626549 RepID=UPI00341283DC